MAIARRYGSTYAIRARNVSNLAADTYGTNTVCLSWTAPPSTARYDGVQIRYSSESYPGSVNDGAFLYEGVGTTVVLGLTDIKATAICAGKCGLDKGLTSSDIFTTGTTYYFSVFSFYYDGQGNKKYNKTRPAKISWVAEDRSINTVLGVSYVKKTTSSYASFTVPEKVHRIKFFVVGSGGGGARGSYSATGGSYPEYHRTGGAGGAGGKVVNQWFEVVPGQVIQFSIGAASGGNASGSQSKVYRSDSDVIATANGGSAGGSNSTGGWKTSGYSSGWWQNTNQGSNGSVGPDGQYYGSHGGGGYGAYGGSNAGRGAKIDSSHTSSTAGTNDYGGGGGGGYAYGASDYYSPSGGGSGAILYTWE